MIFGKKGREKTESIEDRLFSYIDKLQEQKSTLIELGNQLGKFSEDSPEEDLGGKLKNRSLEAMSFANSTVYFMVGYDTEMLAMSSMVKDQFREICYHSSHAYMTNTKNMLERGLPYLVVLGKEIGDEDMEKVLEGFFQAYKRTMSLYDECLNILKPATGD